jgi:hypothetical protein
VCGEVIETQNDDDCADVDLGFRGAVLVNDGFQIQLGQDGYRIGMAAKSLAIWLPIS